MVSAGWPLVKHGVVLELGADLEGLVTYDAHLAGAAAAAAVTVVAPHPS